MLKKLLVILPITAILLLSLTIMTGAETAGDPPADRSNGYYVGDTDGDGIITVMDATKIQRLLVQLYVDEDGMAARRGDTDGNGLDILDATKIQRYLVQYSVSAPIGTWVSLEEPTSEATEPSVIPSTSSATDDDELPFIPI